MRVDELFATPIGMNLIECDRIEKYNKLLKNLFDNNEVQISEYGWKTTEDNLHTKIEFKGLVDIISENAKIYSEDVLGVNFQDFKLTGMWSNSHSSNSRHGVHQHPNSFFSGVLYMKIPENEHPGRIFFVDPRVSKNMMFADFTKQTHVSERSWWYEPISGLLMFFPSWLEHGTKLFISNSEKERISLSFNYVLTKCTKQPTMRF